MMGARVTITIDGVDEVIQNLTNIGDMGQENLVKLTAKLAKDTQSTWKENTPKGKTERLSGGDVVEPNGLTFEMLNSVYYYRWVDEGHDTPKGWRTKHGYRPAKRQSHVKGREMTPKTVDFIKGNITEYLSKFLDGA